MTSKHLTSYQTSVFSSVKVADMQIPSKRFLSPSSLNPASSWPSEAKGCLPSLSTARPSWARNREAKTQAQERSACQPGQPYMVRIDRPLGKTSSPTSLGFPSEMPREEKNQEREWAQGENAQWDPFSCCWPTAVRESCRDLGERRPEH